RTDNSWGPLAIGDHGAPVSLPKLKKAYEKGTRGISWGPLLTPGPWAVPEGSMSCQSAPGTASSVPISEALSVSISAASSAHISAAYSVHQCSLSLSIHA
ncbi:unnamed protein product, partial [Staurois parvus]